MTQPDVNESSTHPDAPEGAADIARLLTTEGRLDDYLDAARTQASTLLESARTLAAAREAALQADLETDRQELERSIIQQARDREARLATETREQVQELDGVASDRLEQLARFALDRIIGSGR